VNQPGDTCPSSTAAPGNLLIGIVRPDGTVAAIRPALEVDAEFVARAEATGRAPEERLRFAGPCAGSSCRHWTNERCGLVELLSGGALQADSPADSSAGGPPPCQIRSTCRWWSQRGPAACRVCPVIVRGATPRETTVTLR
jgi:hypothetical protein